jgi:peptidoglycan-N-acetylglucosamine deacetylase
MRFFRPFGLFRVFFPEAVFRLNAGEKSICLTFDDGPFPDTTPQLLETLERHDVKAVFFLNGRQADKYPRLAAAVREGGHITGNHGYDHLDGWRTGTQKYTENIQKADDLTSDRIFRPPFGRLTPSQYRILSRKYRIFMWDLMPYDFDPGFGPVKSLNITRKMIRRGSIIVMHDNPQSFAAEILDEILLFASENGFVFVLPEKDGSFGKHCLET